uniref:FHF complex subunit HOOK interacting protein 2B n=1 Tax=Scleropages formosus TaxID=113540 RepID=A0A8D0CLT1_SCLFO
VKLYNNREPSVNLLESFVEHWKGITNYYIESTGEQRHTDIPWRLRQMLDILVYEERQQESEETGPCMEYLLQHKILETLCTLAKAQYPPGMNQQVLAFFSKLLAQIQQPVLHIINVYRPVQKMIRLCARPGSQTEREEAQFLLVICSRLKQDPYVLSYILEAIASSDPSSTSRGDVAQVDGGTSSAGQVPSGLQQESTACEIAQAGDPDQQSQHVSDDTDLIHALVALTRSQKSRVALKAHEGLLLLVALPGEGTAVSLAENTRLCEMVTERLCELYSLIPSSLDPADIYGFPQMEWRTHFPPKCQDEDASFPGREQLEDFLVWLDFCNQLVKEAQMVLSVKLAKAIHHQWFAAVLQPQLLQMSEAGMLLTTTLLSCIVRHVSAPTLLEELVHFVLGDQRDLEHRASPQTFSLRHHLIEHCNHISDEISIATLRFFEELLQKSHEHILFNLVLRNLAQRNYVAPSPSGGSGAEERHLADTEFSEEELEEDPFFTDMYLESDFEHSRQLAAFPERRCELGHPSGETQVANIVNSFLCLVPQEAKTSQYVKGAGYETYIHDAHKLYKECKALSLEWGWPQFPEPLAPLPVNSDFFEGHFLQVLFDRIAHILEQPYELNLQVTSVLSRLAAFPHPHLHEYLLDPYISLAPRSRSLFSVLVRVIGDLMQRIQHIPNFTEKLVHIRKQLMGLESESAMDHVALLKGVIVLEEFCKELAAVVFVKHPVEEC